MKKEPKNPFGVLIRFRNKEEKQRFKKKCVARELSYREAILEWIDLSTGKTIVK